MYRLQWGLNRLKVPQGKLVVYTIYIAIVISLDIYTDLLRFVPEVQAIQFLYYMISAEVVFVFVDVPEKSLNEGKWDNETFYAFVIAGLRF